jgi:hypothetical protein
MAFNKKLTEWLIEYNFHRPHEALGYETPIEFNKVLPMYPSGTGAFLLNAPPIMRNIFLIFLLRKK